MQRIKVKYYIILDISEVPYYDYILQAMGLLQSQRYK